MQKVVDDMGASQEGFLEMKDIAYRYAGVIANDRVNLEIKKGEIHAILGENGAGKTTLMNILFGLLQPDSGEIRIEGEKVAIKSPKHSNALGIRMVHQHFMLIPSLSIFENLILASPKGIFFDRSNVEKKIDQLAADFNFKIDKRAKIWQLSVGERQRVEILKALYQGVKLLILDEPTAVLTPPEVKDLIRVLKTLAKQNLTVIPFITHKLPEVMELSDRVTVLRKGKSIGTFATKDTTEDQLAKKMIGKEIKSPVPVRKTKKEAICLEAKNLTAMNDLGTAALDDVTFLLKEGSILGIAGVSGNGQRELAEVLIGVRKLVGGELILKGENITNLPTWSLINKGIACIPEDRINEGLIMNFSMAENAILENHVCEPFAHRGIFPFMKPWLLDKKEIEKFAKQLIEEYSIKVPDTETIAGNLSGGNMQRLILARKLSQNPTVLIASQPTGGLDISATAYVHNKILDQKNKGISILLVSDDLNEIMKLSDEIAVMYKGKIVAIFPSAEASSDVIGCLMAGINRKQEP